MERGKIIISGNSVRIMPDEGAVWLTKHEIANLFGCFVAKIGCNIRAILKSETLDECEVCRTHFYDNGNGIEHYNLGMIIALAFRIRSHNADLFRQWMIKRAVQETGRQIPFVIALDGNALLN